MGRANRPKWAQRLTSEQWQYLRGLQGLRVPTLKNLKHDIAMQKAFGFENIKQAAIMRTINGV